MTPRKRAGPGTSNCKGTVTGRQDPSNTRWWFQIFFIFTPKIGEDSHFDEYFSKGLKPPTRIKCCQVS